MGDDFLSRLSACDASVLKLPALHRGSGYIVRKALALVPAERYQSVEQLAADMRRYRNGEPVLAHAPSLRYRAGKFAQRNKLALGAGVLLLLMLLTGIGGVVWQYRLAVVERRKAEARADDLRKLSNSLLTEINEAIQKLPGSTQAQQLLVSTVLEHLNRTVRDSAGDSQLEVDAARAYVRLANVQSSLYNQNIGDGRGALASLAKALSIVTPLRQGQPRDVATKQVLALAWKLRGDVLFGMGRTQEAVVEMRSAVAAFEELASAGGASPSSRVDALLEMGGSYTHLGD